MRITHQTFFNTLMKLNIKKKLKNTVTAIIKVIIKKMIKTIINKKLLLSNDLGKMMIIQAV